jgi:hypothetical protein
MYNPLWSALFGNGQNGDFIIEILQESSNIVLEERVITQSVSIIPGLINTQITPANLFVLSNTNYEVTINLLQSLNASEYIRIRFPLSWTLYNNSCLMLTGFILATQQSIFCENYTDGTYNYLNLTNFIAAPSSLQQSIIINLTTPATVLTAPGYAIEITTWNFIGLMDQSVSYVQLNSTFGTINMLSIDAV